MYSLPCKKVKYSPSVTVNAKAISASVALFASIEWWVHVTVTPDDNSTIVFSSGTPQYARGLIPFGGHIFPSSTVGANLLWKKAQKNAKKKHTSDTINRITPIRRP